MTTAKYTFHEEKNLEKQKHDQVQINLDELTNCFTIQHPLSIYQTTKISAHQLASRTYKIMKYAQRTPCMNSLTIYGFIDNV